ncbi:MAG: squalene/phytoene synthase family protein [Pseudomonadota bacterium]
MVPRIAPVHSVGCATPGPIASAALPVTDFDALLEHNDPDRRLAAMFAEPLTRGRLLTLYAFYHEVARVPDAVSEPVIGEMRLAWAREAVEDLFASPPKVRRHDIYEALYELITAPGGPDQETLISLVEARAADLGEGPFLTRDDRRDYVDRTAVALMRSAVRICAPGVDLGGETGVAVMAAGRLWGFTGLLRAFPALCHAGRPPFTAEELAGSQLSETELRRGRAPDKAKAGLEGLCKEAGEAAALLTRTRASLPANLFPAVGYATLGRAVTKRAARITDPYRQPVEPSVATRQPRLVWASLTGRV